MNKLGFGFLRIPRLDEKDETSIDYAATCALADTFLAAGGKYFDTAYNYLSGASETALRDCVVQRHPRESFLIADKMPVWKLKCKADLRAIFEEQKVRCGVDYFDVYLLHALNRDYCENMAPFEPFAFLQELKASGEARRTGFSFHDSPELLDELLTAHPEVDLVQLQINYLDWNSTSLQAKRCYDVAVRHGKGVIVMEPVKGGSLSILPEAAAEMLRELDPDVTPSGWALRFAQSLENVEVVLSGMNAPEQVAENLRDVPPLTDEQRDTLLSAAEVLRSSIAVPCTACEYCVPGCPKHIPIPRYFALYNDYARTPAEVWKMRYLYNALAEAFAPASDCIDCKKCENSCPQHLPITEYLPKMAEAFKK